jgi:predicted Zn-dependent protease with MMP-like domain
MNRSEFEKLVQEALDELPDWVHRILDNVAVVVEDVASRETLNSMGLRGPLDLLGLYQGISLDRRGFYYGNVLPDKITLYQRAIEYHCRSGDEIVSRVKEVVLHELGHYFGLDEEELRNLLPDDDL